MATHLWDGLHNSRKYLDTHAHTGLDRCLAHHLKTYGIEYPYVKQEKSIHIGIIHTIVAESDPYNYLNTYHIYNLVQLGLYFCLRS